LLATTRSLQVQSGDQLEIKMRRGLFSPSVYRTDGRLRLRQVGCFSFSSSISPPRPPDADADDNNALLLHPLIQQARSCPTSQHLETDRSHIWHPYTSFKAPQQPVLPVAKASQCTLTLEDGTELLDGMSSWWAAVWGYQHSKLDQAITRQLSQMSHVMFGGLTHRPATELATILLEMTKDMKLTKIFFSDSGSVAVEVALKMALQYHRGLGSSSSSHNNEKKTKFIAVRGGYHGDTLGAMSVCDPINGMHSAFQDSLAKQIFTTRPPCDPSMRVGGAASTAASDNKGCQDCSCQGGSNYEAALKQAMADLEVTIQTNHQTCAALILEPIVQGAGGMRFYDPIFLQRARQLCDDYNILLICDEIATGFGRSGGSDLFASQVANIRPDIMCIGKALTGGYMSLGAVLTTDQVAEGVSSSPDDSVVSLPLMHGPTFMGNPLACSAAVASMSMMLQPTCSKTDPTPLWKSSVTRLEQELRLNLKDAWKIQGVAQVRVKGAIGVIEMVEPLDGAWVTNKCQELGVWLRPFGKLLYTMPPYIMTTEELIKVTNAMMTIAEQASWTKR
jgi:adenosylmethionine-8-amino-7-oxononanoate aminotransferase